MLNDLIIFDRPFFIGCIDKPRKTVEKKNIPDDQYWYATYSKRNDTWSSAIHKNNKAKILISEEWVHSNLPKFTGDEDAYKHKPLPPLLELSEEEKFRDNDGKVYEVEVRGEKTKQSIRFSWTDVSKMLEMKTNDLRYTIDKTEYEIFYSDALEHNKSSIYLSHNGLLEIIFVSRSKVAHQFKE